MLKQVIPTVGVPFLSKTRIEKKIRIVEHSKTKLILDMDSKSLDVPYGNSFKILEQWYVIADHAESNKCIARYIS